MGESEVAMPKCYKCGIKLGMANWTGGPDKFWHRYGCPEIVDNIEELRHKENHD